MHVGPMINGNSAFEFILDEKAAKYIDRQIGMDKYHTIITAFEFH